MSICEHTKAIVVSESKLEFSLIQLLNKGRCLLRNNGTELEFGSLQL